MVMFHCHVSFLDGTCTNKTLVSCDVLRFSISHFLFRLPQICQSWCFSHSWEPNPPTESKKWKKSWRGVHPLHHPAHEVSPACLMLHQQNRFYIRLTSTELVLRFHVYIYITGYKPEFWSIKIKGIDSFFTIFTFHASISTRSESWKKWRWMWPCWNSTIALVVQMNMSYTDICINQVLPQIDLITPHQAESILTNKLSASNHRIQ